jgi:hypothetical protein
MFPFPAANGEGMHIIQGTTSWKQIKLKRNVILFSIKQIRDCPPFHSDTFRADSIKFVSILFYVTKSGNCYHIEKWS